MSQSMSFVMSRLLSFVVYCAALVLIVITASLAARDPVRRGPALLQAAGAAILLLGHVAAYFASSFVRGYAAADIYTAIVYITTMSSSLGWILFAGGYLLERRVSRFPRPLG